MTPMSESTTPGAKGIKAAAWPWSLLSSHAPPQPQTQPSGAHCSSSQRSTDPAPTAEAPTADVGAMQLPSGPDTTVAGTAAARGPQPQTPKIRFPIAVYSHRGGPMEPPGFVENTLPAFRNSARLKVGQSIALRPSFRLLQTGAVVHPDGARQLVSDLLTYLSGLCFMRLPGRG